MIFAYKNYNKPSNFLAKSRLYKISKNPYELDEDIKSEIQTTFLQILSLNQAKTAEEFKIIFENIEEIINIKEYQAFIPKIVSHSIYPELVQILSEIEDEYIHRVTARIIVFLTGDVTDSLIRFAESNLMDAIYSSIPSTNVMKYSTSIEYIFQIIANFLDDPHSDVCEYAHQYFKIDRLFEIFNKINEESNKTNSELILRIIKRWMSCIFTTISKFPNELTIDDTTNILFQIKDYLDIFLKEPILCQHLCYSISTLIDNKLINYNEFNEFNYSNMIFTISTLNNESVKTYAFHVIGELISLNAFTVSCDFSYFFDVVLKSNQSTDRNLIFSALRVCHSFLQNPYVSEKAFEQITNNMPFLFDLYDKENFDVKYELKILFHYYLIYCVRFHNAEFENYSEIIFKITDIFFDFIQVEDEVSYILKKIFKSLLCLNKYLNNLGQIYLPSAIQYIQQYNECIGFLKDSENTEISEFVHALLVLDEDSIDQFGN